MNGKYGFRNVQLLLRKAVVILCLYLPFFAFAQQGNAVISNIIRGSVVGTGWSSGGTSGGITERVFFDCSNCSNIGTVYLLSLEAIANDTLYTFPPSSVVINGQTHIFSDETSFGTRFFESNGSSHKCHLLEIDFQCIGDSIEFYIPPQDFQKAILSYYLLMECVDQDAPPVGYSVVFNTSDTDPNVSINLLNQVPLVSLDLNNDAGFSIVGNVMYNMDTDGSNIHFNGNYLGKIGGEDASSQSYPASGSKGYFYYSYGTLSGLDDDTPDDVMYGTDALAEVSELFDVNGFYFSCIHEAPPEVYSYYSNPVLAGILTYTPQCEPFDVNVPSDTVVCKDIPVQLQVSGGVQYEWSPAVSLSCTDCPDPVFSADSSQFYSVKIWNNDSCFVVRPFKVNVREAMAIDTVLTEPEICGVEQGSAFVAVQVSGSAYGVDDSPLQSSAYFHNLPAGMHTFYYLDNLGCSSDTVEAWVSYENHTQVSFTADPQGGYAPLTVQLTNTSQNVDAWEWVLDGVAHGTNLSSTTFGDEGSHTVQLIGWANAPECADTATVVIHVMDTMIVSLPNVFTPNGDGVNDFFTVQTTQTSNYSLVILNRWGTEVHRITGMLQPGTAAVLWDGAHASEGVYFVRLKLTTTSSGKEYELQEMVTLEK